MRLAWTYSGSSGFVRADPNTVTFWMSRNGANTANASRISVIAAAAIFRSSGSGSSLTSPTRALQQLLGETAVAARRRARRGGARASAPTASPSGPPVSATSISRR